MLTKMGWSQYRLSPWSFLLLLFAAGFLYKLADWTKDPNRTLFTRMSFKTVESGKHLASVTIQRKKEIVKQYPACPIPQLEPFDKRILHLLQMTPPDWNCEAKYPPLFKSSLDSRLIPENETIRKEGYVSCCYKTVEKVPLHSDDQRISTECFPLSITDPTKVPDPHELIVIYCRKNFFSLSFGRSLPVDVHAFVPPRPIVPGGKESIGRGDKLNVVIFGIDAMSRMNYQRNLPHSYAFLKDELGAVEMLGYNKIAENTHPNIIPFLSSNSLSEHLRCEASCPYIWRKYSEKGYLTSFVEDVFDTFMFRHLRPGLKAYPPDYYIRPLTGWAKLLVGSYDAYDGEVACYGPRLTFQFVLDYMEKYVYRMGEAHKNFFQFTWASALTHGYQAGAHLGDPHLLKSLKWLKDSGYLNNTLLIVMSDHGNMMENFRGSIQGQLERRLPGMFFVFPDSFKEKYGRAYQNLLGNRDKLMTTFDVYETLKDILDLDGSVQGPALDKREQKTSLAAAQSASLPRGLSLFLPIPESRTCRMAGIGRKYCSCNSMKPIPLDSPFIPDMTKAALYHINHILKDHPQCSPLQLLNVTLAQQTGTKGNEESHPIDWEAYIINFVTAPGGGEFEAYIDKSDNWAGASVQGNIERTNAYGPTSHCIKDRDVRPYCYCLDQSAAAAPD